MGHALAAADAVDDAQELAERATRWSALLPSTVVGTMPNIVADRLNSQFDLGDRLTLSANSSMHNGAGAGGAPLRQAKSMRGHGRGRPQLRARTRSRRACIAHRGRADPGDAAVMMVLKRAEDARRDNDTIYGLLPAATQPTGRTLHVGTAPEAFNVTPLVGHAHAASGLLQVAAGVLLGYLGIEPDGSPATGEQRAIVATLDGLGGQRQELTLLTPAGPRGDRQTLAQQLTTARGDVSNAKLVEFPAHLPPSAACPR